jgi:hypothetical protein
MTLGGAVRKVKRSAKRIRERCAHAILKRALVPLAPVVRRMAERGEGADACLRRKCLPMQVHFYSPVPDIAELKERKVFDAVSEMRGIDFRLESQVELLAQLGASYGDECDWPLERSSDPLLFHQLNGTFSFGCAAVLHSMIRSNKPRRIIEVGGGNSSKVIRGALELNSAADDGISADYTIIDPYPSRAVLDVVSSGAAELLAEKVELLEPGLFERLEAGDILFVDSGHTVKIGSDVNYLILDILPRLRPGVLVHFHDINLPYAPPEAYYTNPEFRVFWTEEYLLQAFLAFNSDFEVLAAVGYVQRERPEDFRKAFPRFDPATNWANSGSFWIRRKGA